MCGACVAGIWPMVDNPEADPSACQRSTNGSMLAVVNEAGALRLYSWPPVSKTVRRLHDGPIALRCFCVRAVC